MCIGICQISNGTFYIYFFIIHYFLPSNTLQKLLTCGFTQFAVNNYFLLFMFCILFIFLLFFKFNSLFFLYLALFSLTNTLNNTLELGNDLLLFSQLIRVSSLNAEPCVCVYMCVFINLFVCMSCNEQGMDVFAVTYCFKETD